MKAGNIVSISVSGTALCLSAAALTVAIIAIAVNRKKRS